MNIYNESALRSPAGTENAAPPEDIQPILMSVKEMGTLLGLKKTERCWLVHKNVFDFRQFAGRTWIVRDRFEKWYPGIITEKSAPLRYDMRITFRLKRKV